MSASSSDSPPGGPAGDRQRGRYRGWYGRQPTLLPGGRPADPALLFIVTAVAAAFAGSVGMTLYGLYAVRDVGLTPLQLVLVGTAMEATAFLFELPTGVVADVFSRRLSQIIGFTIFAIGMFAMALFPSFAGILAYSIIWTFGWTFISGAREAWLADEVGESAAARLYPRAAQWRSAAIFAGIPLGGAIGLLDIRLAIAVGGFVYLAIALGMALTMTERGFSRRPGPARAPWREGADVALRGLRVIRTRRVLIAMLAIALLMGTASEAFDRLWPLHLLEGFRVPGEFDEVIWFAAIAMVAQAGGLLVLRATARVTDAASSGPLVRLLLVSTLVMAAGIAVFAAVPAFWVALGAYWVVQWVRIARDPFFIAWVNRGLDPRARATVLSMVGQSDALGQITGGPVIGVIATLRDVRTALIVSAAVLTPSLGFYWRHRHGESIAEEVPEAADPHPSLPPQAGEGATE